MMMNVNVFQLDLEWLELKRAVVVLCEWDVVRECLGTLMGCSCFCVDLALDSP
jgi:hypothetical protein